MDCLDQKIIGLLKHNARLTNTYIAKQLNVSEGTIRSRINRLVEEGTLHFTVNVNDSTNTPGVVAFVGLKVFFGSNEQVRLELQKYEEVKYLAASSGHYDLLIQIHCTSNQEIHHFVNNKLGKMESIHTVETILILSEYNTRDQEKYLPKKASNE